MGLAKLSDGPDNGCGGREAVGWWDGEPAILLERLLRTSPNLTIYHEADGQRFCDLATQFFPEQRRLKGSDMFGHVGDVISINLIRSTGVKDPLLTVGLSDPIRLEKWSASIKLTPNMKVQALVTDSWGHSELRTFTCDTMKEVIPVLSNSFGFRLI